MIVPVGTGTVGDGKCNISLGTSGTIFSFKVKATKALEGEIADMEARIAQMEKAMQSNPLADQKPPKHLRMPAEDKEE